MITVEDVKAFLGKTTIDTKQAEIFIGAIQRTLEDELKDKFNPDDERIEYMMLVSVKDMFENRTLMQDVKQSAMYRKIVRDMKMSILLREDQTSDT